MPRSNHRSISISGDAYDALHAHCVDRRITTGSLVELLVCDITGKDVTLLRRRVANAEQELADSCTVDVSADLVRRIDDHLAAAYPLHKRPSRKRFVDQVLSGTLVRSSWRLR